MKPRIPHLLLALLLAMLCLTACGGNPAGQETADPDQEIVLAGYRNLAPGEEDGYYCSKILYVWEPLVTQDDSGNPVPCLAQDWTMSEDGTQWTFSLRQGVTFHDGVPWPCTPSTPTPPPGRRWTSTLCASPFRSPLPPSCTTW